MRFLSLRAWLNGEYFSRAFTDEEQAAVLTVALDSGRKQGYWDTGSGKDTQDRVFLLSYAEAAWARLQDSIISQRI